MASLTTRGLTAAGLAVFLTFMAAKPGVVGASDRDDSVPDAGSSNALVQQTRVSSQTITQAIETGKKEAVQEMVREAAERATREKAREERQKKQQAELAAFEATVRKTILPVLRQLAEQEGTKFDFGAIKMSESGELSGEVSTNVRTSDANECDRPTSSIKDRSATISFKKQGGRLVVKLKGETETVKGLPEIAKYLSKHMAQKNEKGDYVDLGEDTYLTFKSFGEGESFLQGTTKSFLETYLEKRILPDLDKLKEKGLIYKVEKDRGEVIVALNLPYAEPFLACGQLYSDGYFENLFRPEYFVGRVWRGSNAQMQISISMDRNGVAVNLFHWERGVDQLKVEPDRKWDLRNILATGDEDVLKKVEARAEGAVKLDFNPNEPFWPSLPAAPAGKKCPCQNNGCQ